MKLPSLVQWTGSERGLRVSRRDGVVDGSDRFWLNLQVTFGLAGGAVWLAGTFFEQDFVAGIGTGLVAAALLLRMARPRGEEDEA